MTTERNRLRDNWLESIGVDPATAEPLVQDASFRQYIRVQLNGQSAMLMDAPPEVEKPREFVEITHLLNTLGVRVPAVIEQDLNLGLVLLEDLGNHTFTKLLNASANDLTLESTLYKQALESLILIQQQSAGNNAIRRLPPYDFDTCLLEASLFTEWFVPAVTGCNTTAETRQKYSAIWQRLYNELPPLPEVLVHRDYHVDNLIIVDHQCAMLDYQDALRGSPAYDVVSLLEDARRDVLPSVKSSLLDYWLDQQIDDRDALLRHYRFWGAQRHCKVAGIFVRLWKRDDKSLYLRHIPRVLRLLKGHLQHSDLAELEGFIANQIGDLEQVPAFSPDVS